MSEVSHGIKPSCARRSQVYSRLSQLWTVHPRTLIDKKASCKAGLCYWGMTPMDIKNTLTTERPHKYLCYRPTFFSRGHATLHLAASVGRSVGQYVGQSVTILNSGRFFHYCSCPTVRDCLAVYLALLNICWPCQPCLLMYNVLYLS